MVPSAAAAAAIIAAEYSLPFFVFASDFFLVEYGCARFLALVRALFFGAPCGIFYYWFGAAWCAAGLRIVVSLWCSARVQQGARG